jgi:hypothetical protein
MRSETSFHLGNCVIIATLVLLSWSFIANKSNWPFLTYDMYTSHLNVDGIIGYHFSAKDHQDNLTKISVSEIRGYEYFKPRNFFYILTLRKKNPDQFQSILADVRLRLKPSVNADAIQKIVVVESHYRQETFQSQPKLVAQSVLE